jgi:hypothetical protein
MGGKMISENTNRYIFATCILVRGRLKKKRNMETIERRGNEREMKWENSIFANCGDIASVSQKARRNLYRKKRRNSDRRW